MLRPLFQSPTLRSITTSKRFLKLFYDRSDIFQFLPEDLQDSWGAPTNLYEQSKSKSLIPPPKVYLSKSKAKPVKENEVDTSATNGEIQLPQDMKYPEISDDSSSSDSDSPLREEKKTLSPQKKVRFSDQAPSTSFFKRKRTTRLMLRDMAKRANFALKRLY